MRIVDVALDDGKLIVTAFSPHCILPKTCPCVHFSGTGHPLLDSPLAQFRAKRRSPTRLQLLATRTGPPIDKAMDASKGTLRLGKGLKGLKDDILYTGIFGCLSAAWTILGLFVVASLFVHFGELRKQTCKWLGCCTFVVAGIAALVRRSIRRNELLPIQVMHLHFRDIMREKNPHPLACPRGPGRAVTALQLEDLLNFFGPLHIRHRDMYYVCGNIIMPLTEPERLSYAELAGPRTVDWFVSHFWGLSFRETVQTIMAHTFALERVNDMGYWICTLANNQWNLRAELGRDVTGVSTQESWKFSSFYLALCSASTRGTLMVMDNEAKPLGRAWCLFEVLQTMQQLKAREADEDFKGLLLGTKEGVLNFGSASIDLPMTLAYRLAKLDLRSAEATDEEDKLMIHSLVQALPGGFDAMNCFVRLVICDAVRQSHDEFESKFNDLVGALSDLPLADCSNFGEELDALAERIDPASISDRRMLRPSPSQSHDSGMSSLGIFNALVQGQSPNTRSTTGRHRTRKGTLAGCISLALKGSEQEVADHEDEGQGAPQSSERGLYNEFNQLSRGLCPMYAEERPGSRSDSKAGCASELEADIVEDIVEPQMCREHVPWSRQH